MVIVDSHCHVSLSWYEPVESLLDQMDQNGVEQAVLIQILGQANNDYQFDCVRRFPGRFASVVSLDTDLSNAPQTLERLADEGISGIRLRAATRSPGDDSIAIWRTAARLKLSVSCPGRSIDFVSPEFAQLIQAVPEVPIVIEHLGSLNIPGSPDLPTLETSRKVFDLARFPNTYIKIHGLGEFCQRAMPVAEPVPFEQPIPPLLDMAYDAFGPHRMMWGSDYPPVSGREGYRNALRLPMDQFAAKGDQDRQLIFGGVAGSVFRILG